MQGSEVAFCTQNGHLGVPVTGAFTVGLHFTFSEQVPICRFQGLDHGVLLDHCRKPTSDKPGSVKLGAVQRR